MRKIITNEHVKNIYHEFKNYVKPILNEIDNYTQSDIVNNIKENIIKEGKFDWNEASLSDYINDLMYMVKGKQFARTINNFAKKYFIDNLCNDFGEEICKNAKKALELHEIYYIGLSNINEEENLKSIIEIFVNKWDTTDGLWRDEFIKGVNNSYKGFRLKISYGVGVRIVPRKNHFPYIALLEKGKNYKPSNGVYPYISYNTIKNKIETGLGYSRDNIPNVNQNILNEIDKYPQSIFSKNEITELVHQVNKNIEEFHRIVNNKSFEMIKEKEIMSNKTKNIILYGVPGVGKTYNHKKLISLLEDGYSDNEIFEIISSNQISDENSRFFIEKLCKEISEESRVKFITFHQSFGYEDFIEGFRPDENGDIKLKDGVFKEFCKDAQKQKDKNFYFIIDEINRANISKVFGELITLIEEDKRDTLSVTLPYSKENFSIPKNLFIIGTMNSTDKSIALIDIALRRRFTFVEMLPNPELVEYEKARELMEKLNDKLPSEYQIGHSYFMKIEDDEELAFTCKYKIQPLLEEYFYGDKEGLKEVLAIL